MIKLEWHWYPGGHERGFLTLVSGVSLAIIPMAIVNCRSSTILNISIP